MRGDYLKKHMLKHEKHEKHENERMEYMKKFEEKEVEKQVMINEQKYEMIRKAAHMKHAESKQKIELGRIMTDIAEEEI